MSQYLEIIQIKYSLKDTKINIVSFPEKIQAGFMHLWAAMTEFTACYICRSLYSGLQIICSLVQ